MHSDNSSYNPDYQTNLNSYWFRDFIMLQDEVSPELVVKKEDSLVHKHYIVQRKIEHPKAFNQSIFTSHLMRNNGMAPKENEKLNYGWTTGIIALCFILFAMANYGYYKRVQQIFKAYFAKRLFQQYSREGGRFGEKVSVLLFISFLLAISVFLYKIYEFYYSVPGSFLSSLLLYIEILTGVIIFILLKSGLYYFVGFCFKSVNHISDYVLNLYLFCQISGIMLLPVIVLVTYLPGGIFIFIGLSALILLFLYSIFLGISIAISNIKISTYYIFLYLCTLEILPLFLIAKVIKNMLI